MTSDCGIEHGLVEHVGVDTIEHFVFLRDATGVDHATDGNAVLFHALEDDAGVEGSAFDGGEEFVLGRVREVPAEGDAAKFGIDEDRAIAIVPGEAEQTGLAGAIFVKTGGKFGDGFSGAAGNGFKNVTGSGEAGFDAGLGRMNGTRNNAANARDEPGVVAHGDDAGGSADDIDDIARAGAGTDGVPVGIEGADGNGNAGTRPSFLAQSG